MTGEFKLWGSILTPVHIKLLKDVAIVGICLIGVLNCLICRRIYWNVYLLFFFASVLISLLLSIPAKNVWVLLAGVRNLLPIFLIIFAYRFVDFSLQERIAKILIALFIIGISLQIFQLLLPIKIYGLTDFGLSRRNPGFYLIPTSMALFTFTMMYYVYCFLNPTVFRSLLVFVLGPISALLTGSGTAYFCLITFFVCLAVFSRQRKLLAPIFLICGIIGLIFLPQLTSRMDIYVSLTERVAKFGSVLNENILFSEHFGDGTTSACLLAIQDNAEVGTLFFADSAFTSTVSSYGLLSLIFLLLAILYGVKMSKNLLVFSSVFVTFMFTTTLLELFPANMLLSLNLVYYMRNEPMPHLAGNRLCS